jgi:hypothetical protein
LAWNTSEEDVKEQVFTLACAQEDITNLAKLTKYILKLADSYKVPTLKFNSDPIKQQKYYNEWTSKIYSFTYMFHQTVRVMRSGAFGTITFYDEPQYIGNKALYMLISSRVDFHF